MKGSGQRAHGERSGGRRIDDHSFFAGGSTKESPLPLNTSRKSFPHSEGAGQVMDYQDHESKIHSNQERADSQTRKHQGRLPEYRN